MKKKDVENWKQLETFSFVTAPMHMHARERIGDDGTRRESLCVKEIHCLGEKEGGKNGERRWGEVEREIEC